MHLQGDTKAEKDAAIEEFAKAIGLGPAQIVVDGKFVDPPLNDVEAHRQRVDAAIAKDNHHSKRWTPKIRGTTGSGATGSGVTGMVATGGVKSAGLIAALNLEGTRSATRGSPAERPGAPPGGGAPRRGRGFPRAAGALRRGAERPARPSGAAS